MKVEAVKLQIPYTESEKKNNKRLKSKIVRKIVKGDKLSVFMVVSTVLLVGCVGYIAYTMIDRAEASNGRDYVDKALNFTVNVPYSWEVSTPDSKNLEKEVAKTTGGVLFNMRLHALDKELVPLALIQPDPNSKSFSKIMTMAFRGSDINYSYLNDKKALKKDFKTLLKKLGNKDLHVSAVDPISTEYLKGFIVSGYGTLDKRKISYVQYFEPAGANIMSITYGTIGDSSEALDDIERITRSLVYFEGGEFTPSPKRLDGQTEEQGGEK